ncbi:coiled-coil and C2 domain-containing protein 1-like isoform X1 [Malaya genurostris]|uniref:coiled-coil and C2 domain-containing protein 1-like isoform X1 n=1 Tax=Malaya genurostris TaxID=325434 RepID=UPI0026F3EF1E|nr:coiled-coil and C2 domain-containing protein 1-like isoform X1 [Malaya genurostris]
MFSFNKKPAPVKKDRKRDPTEFGLFGINDGLDDDGSDGDIDGDDDLEAELAAISSGSGAGKKVRPKSKPKGDIVAPEALDAMVAASLRDIGSDEELSDDEDDADLMNELAAISGGAIEEEPELDRASPPKKASSSGTTTKDLIKSRIEMYVLAEDNAKKTGDSGKARRFNRGLKTLKDMLKQVEAGKSVDPSEIPPEVSVKIAGTVSAKTESPKEEKVENIPAVPTVPTRRAPAPPPADAILKPEPLSPATLPPSDPPPVFESTSSSKVPEVKRDVEANPDLLILTERKNQYKAAALQAKKAGNTEKAIKYMKTVKQFDTVINALESGQEVDLSKMPPAPSDIEENLHTLPPPVPPRRAQREENRTQKDAEVPVIIPATEPIQQPVETVGEEEEEEVLIQASSILEALQQRLDKYKSVEKSSKDEGNASKARRMGRIVKQYEDAIKMHKAGKTIPIDELPTPPGYAPIPVDTQSVKPQPVPSPRPAPKSNPVPAPIAAGPSKEPGRALTQNEKQIAVLSLRLAEYRQAALEAKKAGELEEAKEYIRTYKGLEKLIETARGGIPIDMATIPIAPTKRSSLEDSFTMVAEEDCTATDDADVDLNTRLEEQLSKQLIMCKNTRDHHRAMGDVAGTNRFENLACTVQKDLDFVRLAHKKRLPVPKFHYEMKQFNVVKCNTDLSDNEVEVTVVRGISYNVPNPKEIDTYVKLEFPYPQDDPFKVKTALVRDTDNPEYNHRQSIEIQRSQRACQRIFKRQAVKFEVFSKGGFLRSDTLIGTVTVKLQPLETQCEIHDSFPLMDGRKTVGGTLEVKIRVRNPILAKQIEQIKEKWLIIDA